LPSALAGIRYVRGDATATDWWEGVAYDGVQCNMALMDIDDLEIAWQTAPPGFGAGQG